MRRKVIKSMVIMEMLPLLVLAVMLCILVIRYNENKYLNHISEILNQEVAEINLSLRQEEERCSLIARNEVLFANLNRDFNKDLEARFEFKQQLRNVLYMVESLRYKSGVEYLFYSDNEDVLIDDRIWSLEKISGQDVYETITGAQELESVWDIRTEESGSLSLVIYQKISNFSRYVNILECTIPFDAYIRDKLEILTGEGIDYVYRDEQGMVMYESREQLNMEMDSFTAQLISGHQVTAYVSEDFHMLIVGKVVAIAASLFLILFLFLYLNIYIISGKITKDLEDFTGRITANPLKYLDHNKTSRYEAEEVNLIEKNFLKVLTELNKLHEEKLEQEKTNNALELELLQAQINPHLLYNSLSTLKWQMLEREEYREADIIDYMVRYYRLVLSKGNSIIALKQELEMVQIYVKLVSCAKNVDIKLELKISELLLEARIPKQLLQPFVENAVLHGFEMQESSLKQVIITAEKEEGRIHILIKDNGIGIGEETARELENGTYRSEYGGYGVVNVIRRMKVCYGESYEVKITGAAGSGTTVSLKYPLIMQ